MGKEIEAGAERPYGKHGDLASLGDDSKDKEDGFHFLKGKSPQLGWGIPGGRPQHGVGSEGGASSRDSCGPSSPPGFPGSLKSNYGLASLVLKLGQSNKGEKEKGYRAGWPQKEHSQ